MRRGIFLVFSNFQYGKTPLSSNLEILYGDSELRVSLTKSECIIFLIGLVRRFSRIRMSNSGTFDITSTVRILSLRILNSL